MSVLISDTPALILLIMLILSNPGVTTVSLAEKNCCRPKLIDYWRAFVGDQRMTTEPDCSLNDTKFQTYNSFLWLMILPVETGCCRRDRP